MWLFVHQPRLHQSGRNGAQAPSELRDQVFITSVEVIEFGALLGRSKNTARWAWLFKTYLQWHAVAYVLSELCTRPAGHDFERAWNAVDSLYDRRMIEQTKDHRGLLWRPLKQMHSRAKKRRLELAGKSPGSSNGSMPSNSPAQNLMNGFPQSTNYIGVDPYMSSVLNPAEALELDFNDPVFGDMVNDGYNNAANANLIDFMNQGQQQSQAGFRATDALPFGFQAGFDFLDDYGGFTAQQNFGQPMPQEWH